MQIIQEIGVKRLIKHIIFTLWQGVFDLLLFSPLRIVWLRFGGATIGKNCVIDNIDFINLDRAGLNGLKIANYCFLGRGVLLDLAGTITLEDWVVISPRAIILSHMSVGLKKHPLSTRYPASLGSTHIKRGVFVGAGATVLHDITIGKEALVGAGSVVTSNVPDRSLATGVPATMRR